jgi:curli biogenesis system outer membrane secretion channel CsgG
MTRQKIVGAALVALIRVTVATAGLAQEASARPTVAIADISVAPGGWTLPPPQLSGAIVEMLVNELVSSQKFRVYDGEWLVPEAEIGRANLSRLRAAAADKQVDYLVVGAVTAFSSEEQRRRFGGLLPKPFILGGVSVNRTQLHVGLNLRIVDVRTGEIVSSVAGDGIGYRKATGIAGLGVIRGLPVGALASAVTASHARDAMLDEAVRSAVHNAALALSVPASHVSPIVDKTRD